MNKKQFLRGLRVGIPISLGYLAVSFALGITAREDGLTALQATITSLLVNASAGQYAAFTVMAAQGGYLEIAIVEAVTNARYILMSAALSQKLPVNAKLWHRLVIGFNVNDEIFGMAIAEEDKLNPFYYFGMMVIEGPVTPPWSDERPDVDTVPRPDHFAWTSAIFCISSRSFWAAVAAFDVPVAMELA